jgi:hypothetical protein
VKQRRSIGRPRKFIISAVMFLLLGAIMNIAVAWGCALAAQRRSSVLPLPDPPIEWRRSVPSNWPSKPRVESFGICRGWGGVVWHDQLAGYPGDFHLCVFRLGMPAASMSYDQLVEDGSYSWRCAVPVPVAISGLGHLNHLPIRPIWPGFAINTLFYAAILWLLLALPGALRRWRRIKRGLCPACAYPVGASALCTECGKPVNPRKAEPASS